MSFENDLRLTGNHVIDALHKGKELEQLCILFLHCSSAIYNLDPERFKEELEFQKTKITVKNP